MKKLFITSVIEAIQMPHKIISRIVYTIFSLGLLFLAFALFWAALKDYGMMFSAQIDVTNVFTSIILTTLAIALFDFAKTLFEEEVILERDARIHREIRRTLTRFVSSILIAISIEALLLVFKFAMTEPQNIIYALELIVGASLLLVSLGLYIYLGAKIETMYSQHTEENNNNSNNTPKE